LTSREHARNRAAFRGLLIHKYHTVVAAWTALDTKLHGRMSYYQFCAACRVVGVNTSPMQLWTAYDHDRQGFISLYEVDEDLARVLESFAVAVWAACGSIVEAWEQYFDRRGLGRCTPVFFATGCKEIGFTGDVDAVYTALNADQCTTSIGQDQFEFIKMWFAPKRTADKVSAFHPHVDAETAALRAAVASKAKPKGETRVAGAREITPKDKFKKLLIQSYGNYVRAWREGLDRDRNGRLDYEEFKMCCADIGYAGPRKEVWAMLDENGSGEVSLGEIDQTTADMLEAFYACVMERYVSWEEAWATHFDHKGHDRVEIHDFRDGCLTLGYGGNVDRLFDCLDCDRTRYLSYDACSWIAGGEAPEDSPLWENVGDFKITGSFKKLTKSQQRRMDHNARDEKVRQRRYEARNRGETVSDKASRSFSMGSLGMTEPGLQSPHGTLNLGGPVSADGTFRPLAMTEPSRSRFAHSAERYITDGRFPPPPMPPPPAAPVSPFRHRLNAQGKRVPWRIGPDDLARSGSLPNLARECGMYGNITEPSLGQLLAQTIADAG